MSVLVWAEMTGVVSKILILLRQVLYGDRADNPISFPIPLEPCLKNSGEFAGRRRFGR